MLGPGLVAQAAIYPLRKAYATARFDAAGRPRGLPATLLNFLPTLTRGAKRPAPPEAGRFAFLGPVRHHRIAGQSVALECAGGTLWLTVIAPDVIRVRLSANGSLPAPFSYAVSRSDEEWPACDFSVAEAADCLVISTSRLVCRIQRSPCRLGFYDPDGSLISEDAGGAAHCGGWVGCWRSLPAGEHVYGLGEKAFGLDQRGRRFEMWNVDPAGYGPGRDPLYMSFPVYMGLRAGRCYALFFDNAYRSIFDVGSAQPATLSFVAEGGELRYHFFYGPAPATVLQRYTELTGRMQLPPIWALGHHQSRWSYYPESRVREIAAEFRTRHIPCDALHFDIHYMDRYRDFTWDRRRFPDPAGLIADLAADGFKSVALIDAGIRAALDNPACASGIERDVFLKYPDGALFSGPVWPGNCYFPDFTDPRARQWWAEQYAGFMEAGLAGTWNDMNEPAVMGPTPNSPPDHVRHSLEGQGADHRAAHNVYGMQMARATHDALRQAQPGRRPFVITRAAFAGVQRYALGWTGDNESTWESLALSIPMVLNLGLSGLAFVGPDTGGFMGDAGGELLARWIQLGAFTPFFRNHSAVLSRDQEPWAFGERYTPIMRRYVTLRYRLLPALYTAFWQCSQDGRPIARPLFWDSPADERAAGIEDQFLLGDHLLVAPVLRPSATERRVYLPAGRWYDWWEDRLHAGPLDLTAEAPLDVLPLYVRAGATVPAAEVDGVRESVDVWQRLRQMTLHVYAGTATSHLYEDAGDGWEHLAGQYRHTTFRTTQDGATLMLSREAEGDFVPTYARFRVVVHGLAGPPTEVLVDGAPITPRWGGAPAVAEFEAGEFREIRLYSSLTEQSSEFRGG